MRKKLKVEKRVLHPDPLYNSPLVARLINFVMRRGQKLKATKIVYAVLNHIKQKHQTTPLAFLQQSIDNLKPEVELKSRKIGGANYQVPVLVSVQRQETLALRWLIEAAKQNRGQTFLSSLENEIINSFRKEGNAIKKKQNIQRMAEANKAFSHFSW